MVTFKSVTPMHHRDEHGKRQLRAHAPADRADVPISLVTTQPSLECAGSV
jgi:hypothetical protein